MNQVLTKKLAALATLGLMAAACGGNQAAPEAPDGASAGDKEGCQGKEGCHAKAGDKEGCQGKEGCHAKAGDKEGCQGKEGDAKAEAPAAAPAPAAP